MPSLGLSLGLGGMRVLGPTYDPDAAAWFEAVEATGATFGTDSATVSANKAAWSDWVIAQKNAESPIAGRSNWDQLTEPEEGYIQPLMGLSTFNVPALFGNREFISFVAGDHDPATGLRGGGDRIIQIDRRWNNTPLNDVSVAVFLTGPPTTGSSAIGRVAGTHSSSDDDVIRNDGIVASRGVAEDTIPLVGISTPRTLVVSRHTSTGFVVLNGEVYDFSGSSTPNNAFLKFLNRRDLNRPSDARLGLATYGRSINVDAMNTACIALSEAIVWPT